MNDGLTYLFEMINKSLAPGRVAEGKENCYLPVFLRLTRHKEDRNMSSTVSDVVYSVVKVTFKVLVFIFKTIFITIPWEVFKLMKK